MGRPGRSKQRISVYRSTTVLDDHFGNDLTRTLIGTYWAQVDRLSGSRGQQYEKLEFNRPYRIEFRSYVDIKEDDELEFSNAVLVVQSVEEDLFKDRYTTVIATNSYKG